MNRLLLLFLIGGLFACQSNQRSEQRTVPAALSVEDSLTARLNEIHQQGQINGFGVAIVNEQGLLYAKGIGQADVQSKVAYTENTIQNIGSVSKTFIGIALLKAQELGQLKLDDPVSDYLPFEVKNPSFPDIPITIRQLTTHTSSIMDTEDYNEKSYVLKDEASVSDSVMAIAENFNAPDAKIPMIDYLEKTLSEQGEWYDAAGFSPNKPGEVFEYTNVGATLAAAVLEIATGKPFDAFVTEHVLQPLNMSSSGWSFDDVDLSAHSTLYANPTTALPHYSLITYPDGGMITSAADLGLYLSELIKGNAGDGTLLSKESYQEIFSEQLSAEQLPGRSDDNDYDDEYNSGIFMGFSPRGFIGHTGGDPGIASYMFFDPATKIGSLMMINTSINNDEGIEEFFSIWYTLVEYQSRLTAKPTNQ